jgi:hypothetical protein
VAVILSVSVAAMTLDLQLPPGAAGPVEAVMAGCRKVGAGA